MSCGCPWAPGDSGTDCMRKSSCFGQNKLKSAGIISCENEWWEINSSSKSGNSQQHCGVAAVKT